MRLSCSSVRLFVVDVVFLYRRLQRPKLHCLDSLRTCSTTRRIGKDPVLAMALPTRVRLVTFTISKLAELIVMSYGYYNISTCQDVRFVGELSI